MIRHKIRQYKLAHLLQTLLLLGSMGLVLVLTGGMIAGWDGMILALLLGVVAFLLSPQFSFHFYLRSQGARRLRPDQAPRLFEITRRLAARAGLSHMPDLYHVPGGVMNAFAVKDRERSAIGLTDGLLRRLDIREIAGILGHEITHIKNNDTGIMGLAALVNRLTGTLSLLGQVVLVFLIPVMLLGRAHMPLAPLLFLVFAPSLSSLLQLALSRTREFEADLGSALLTGDPQGLASALRKLDMQRGSLWKRLLMPGWDRRSPLMQTHPPTNERIHRLLSLQEKPMQAVRPVPRTGYSGFVT
jgi:heat shock protein HtpX